MIGFTYSSEYRELMHTECQEIGALSAKRRILIVQGIKEDHRRKRSAAVTARKIRHLLASAKERRVAREHME